MCNSLENHVIVGELLEAKASQHADINTPKSLPVDVNWNPDSEASQVTGGYSIGFSLTVLQVVYLRALERYFMIEVKKISLTI